MYMCGICGFIDKTGSMSRENLYKMNETLISRGPDGAGIYYENEYGIAMRRLAIIDLENGWQPIFSEDKKIIVVQNGEIYN